MHGYYLVGIVRYQLQVVQGEQGGEPARAGEFLQLVHQLVLAAQIQAGGGFVKHEYFWLFNERLRDKDHLPLPA